MKTLCILILFSLFHTSSQAQNFDLLLKSNEDTLKKCLDKGYIDPYMKRCYLAATQELDAILNIVYTKTLPLLKKSDQLGFRENQRKWLAFYNNETLFNQKVFWSKNSDEKYQFGTLVDLSVATENYKIMKNRIETLSNYYIILTTGL